MNVARSGLYYQRRMPEKDKPIEMAMQRLSGQFPRFGARRIHIFLSREGIELSKNKCSRIWANAGLQVPAKRKRCRRIGNALPRPHAPLAANQVWSYDFVHDACANGQKLKCLTVIDEYTKECLAIDVSGSIRSSRVVDVLSRLIAVRGAPQFLRSDNGPEFVSTKLLDWAKDNKLQTILIEPGKPWQNGTNESFNGKFRDECLAIEWFRNRFEAKVIISDWVAHYNRVRPHSSLKYLTPEQFATGLDFVKNEAEILSCGW